MAKAPRNREEKEQRREVAEKREREQRVLNAQLREADKITQSILDKEDISLENYADKLQLSAQLNQNAKIQATILSKIENLNNSGVKNADILVEQYGLIGDLVSRVQSKFSDVVLNSSNIASSGFEIVDISQELVELSDKQFELDEMRKVLGKQEYENLVKMLEVAKERLGIIKNTNDAQETANKLAKDYLSSNTLIGAGTKSLLHTIEDWHKSAGTGGLGIIGEVLGNKAGKYIEEIETSIQDKIVKAFQDSGESAINAFSVAQMAFGSFIKFALPALGIVGLLGAIGFLIHSFQHLDEELSEIGKSFGLSRHEAEGLHLSAKGLAKEMKIVGINAKEVQEGFGGVVEITNGLQIGARMAEGSESTKQLIKDVSVLQSSFGMAINEAGGIAAISDFATVMRKSMGQIVKESLKLGKNLITTKGALAIIGKIAPSIAVAFKKGSVELIKAAQRAKLLGMELDDIADFGDKILEIETSLESEMAARVITGKQLNFDLARQYALQGDVASLQEEMLRQVGSLSEFQSMNRLQQKYLAEAFGMTVDEVAKMLIAQERLVNLGLDQAKMDELQTMNAAELAEEIKKTNNEKLKGYLVTLAKEKESASINERISDAMTKIKEKIAGTLAPLVEQAHEFLNSSKGAEFLEKVAKGIEKTLKAIVPVIQFLAEHMWILGAALGIFAGAKLISGVGSLVSLFKGLGGASSAAKPAIDALGGAFGDLSKQMGTATDATGQLTQSMGGASGGANTLGGFVSSLSTTAVNMAIIGVALIAFAGAVWILAKAFQEFGKVQWEKAWPGVGVMMGLAAAAWVLAASVKGMAIAAAGVGLLSLALLSFGAAVLMIGTGAKMFSESIGIMADGVKKFTTISNIDEIASNITKIVESIAGISETIDPDKTKNVKKALKNLGIEQLAEFGKIANTDLKKAGQNIVDGINSLIGINESIDWTNIQKTFYQLNSAIFGLKLESVQALGEIAKTDMQNLGKNLQTGINSLKQIDISGSVETLKNVEQVFSQLQDSLMQEGLAEGGGFGSYESYLSPLKDMASLEIDKIVYVTSKLKDVIYNLANLGQMTELNKGGMTITSGLDQLKLVIESLSEAIKELDVEKLKDLSNVNVENLRTLSTVFQQPIGVGNANVSTTRTKEDNPESKKLDQVISLLRDIFNSSNQPMVIKIGDRTVETIGLKLKQMGQYNAVVNADGRVPSIGGR